MCQRWVVLSATFLAALSSSVAEWPGNGAYRLQCEVRAANAPRESLSAGTFVDFHAKFKYYLGAAGQTADEGSLRVVEIDSEGKETRPATEMEGRNGGDR